MTNNQGMYHSIADSSLFPTSMLLFVFPQAPFRATNVPRPTLVSSNCATAPWLPEEAVGDYVTPFVLERLFDYSCSVEFAGSYYRHVPCKFRKVCLGLKYLPQINYGGN